METDFNELKELLNQQLNGRSMNLQLRPSPTIQHYQSSQIKVTAQNNQPCEP